MSTEEDLDLLRRALAPPPLEPSAGSLGELRRSVAAMNTARTAPAPRRWPRRLAAGGAGLITLLGGAGAAFAVSGAAMPTPVRSVLYGVGLPVDSVPVAETRSVEARLSKAIRDGDEAGITADIALLRVRLAHLPASDRAELQPGAAQLLVRAGQPRSEPKPAIPPSPSTSTTKPATLTTSTLAATTTTSTTGRGNPFTSTTKPNPSTTATTSTRSSSSTTGVPPSSP